MSDVDIFASKPDLGEFVRLREVGDSVQGTYIDVRDGVDSFGNPQTIYVLKDKNGKIWNMGMKKSNSFFHEKMRGIRFGQIVGFRFDGKKQSKRNPGQSWNDIKIFADPKVTDKDWLDQQEKIEHRSSSPSPEYSPAAVVSSNVRPVVANVPTIPTPENTILESIRSLARSKGITTEDNISSEKADIVIEKAVGLPLIEENYTQIIVRLSSHRK